MTFSVDDADPMRRLVAEFGGHKICDLTPDQQLRFFSAIAERGAANALAGIGLNDQYAINDIRDLRSIIKGYRMVRKTVWSSFWTQLGRTIAVILTLILLGFAVDQEKVKAIAKMIGG